MPEVTCSYCEKTFTRKNKSNNGANVFCTPNCRQQFHYSKSSQGTVGFADVASFRAKAELADIRFAKAIKKSGGQFEDAKIRPAAKRITSRPATDTGRSETSAAWAI